MILKKRENMILLLMKRWNSCNTLGLENIMFKKLFILFKIARKLALSDALKVISKQHQPPFIIKVLLNLFQKPD